MKSNEITLSKLIRHISGRKRSCSLRLNVPTCNFRSFIFDLVLTSIQTVSLSRLLSCLQYELIALNTLGHWFLTFVFESRTLLVMQPLSHGHFESWTSIRIRPSQTARQTSRYSWSECFFHKNLYAPFSILHPYAHCTHITFQPATLERHCNHLSEDNQAVKIHGK